MNPTYTFLKSVKGTEVLHRLVEDTRDVERINRVLEKLAALPKVIELKLEELDIRTNAKRWVASLLTDYPSGVQTKDAEYLPLDFTEPMRTRMREESKYAIALLEKNRLILCHSLFGEETITPEWKTIPRMLDSDNVLRYVWFADRGGAIIVRFWEREASSSFMEWLGLRTKQAFLFGGRYRIRYELEGLTGELQLTDEEMESWMEGHPELKEGTIRLSTPIQLLKITEIRAAQRRYEHPGDFVQDFLGQRYGIPLHQTQYQRICKDVLPLWTKVYDEKTRVVRMEEGEVVTEVTKSIPDLDIIFAGTQIDLRASYAADLATRFINGERLRIYHAGLRFAEPFKLGPLEIYNPLHLSPVAQSLAEYYNRSNLQEGTLRALLASAVLRALGESNADSPIAVVLQRLFENIVKTVVLVGKWGKLEDHVLDYKSRDFLAGSDDQVVERLRDDVKSKVARSPYKVYILGVEDDGTVGPLPASRLKSDRVENIRKRIQDGLHEVDVFALPLVVEQEGVLLLAATRR